MKEHAQKLGPIGAGRFRVVIIEADLRVSHRDFDDLGRAKAYADDACSEADSDTPPVAQVFDTSFNAVYIGRPYNLR